MSCERKMLTEGDREEISRGAAEGLEVKVIAARIGRYPSVVSREITRHCGRASYRAVVTHCRLPPGGRRAAPQALPGSGGRAVAVRAPRPAVKSSRS
ncbi:MAG: helix-turn-helix domain-containing protein [Pseudonocardiaceae bacterium]